VHPVTVTTLAGVVHVHEAIPVYPVGEAGVPSPAAEQDVQTPDNE
jgi:hypothetical protein